MANHVWPQHGDKPDAANFAQVLGQANLTDFVETGMDVEGNVDFASLTFSVDAGVAFIKTPSMDTAHPDYDSTETRTSVGHVVELPQQTGESLSDSALNHIYLRANLGVSDDAFIDVNTTGSAPSEDSLKIATVDTSSNEVTEVNRNPEVVFESVSVPAGEITIQGEGVKTHIDSESNPHNVTHGQVGAIEDANGSVSESHLSFDTATQSEFNSHSNDTDNPHSVTASQIGNVENMSTAGSSGTVPTAQGDGTLAMESVGVDDSGNVLGGNITDAGANQTALTPNAHVNSSDVNQIVGGYNATTSGSRTIALGDNASASISSGIALGDNSTSDGGYAISIGGYSVASGSESVAIGRNAEAVNNDEGILGVDSSTNGPSAWNVPGSLTVGEGLNMDSAIDMQSNRINNTKRLDFADTSVDGIKFYMAEDASNNDLGIHSQQAGKIISVKPGGNVDFLGTEITHNGQGIVTSETSGGYVIHKNGADGSGIINFKT